MRQVKLGVPGATAVALAVLLALACSEPQPAPPAADAPISMSIDTAQPPRRSITMTTGDSLGLRVGTDGQTLVTLTVLEGKPDAGKYTSDSEALAVIARDAKNSLGDANTTVTVDVDDAGEIVKIAYEIRLTSGAPR